VDGGDRGNGSIPQPRSSGAGPARRTRSGIWILRPCAWWMGRRSGSTRSSTTSAVGSWLGGWPNVSRSPTRSRSWTKRLATPSAGLTARRGWPTAAWRTSTARWMRPSVGEGLLRRVRALVDVRFSNSRIESGWSQLKPPWLFLHRLETAAAVRRHVAFDVAEYNATIPHAAFSGQTPDEIYFGRGDPCTRALLSDPGGSATPGPCSAELWPDPPTQTRLPRVLFFRGSITRLTCSLSTLRREGRPSTTQDSLPAAGQALPGGVGYPLGPS